MSLGGVWGTGATYGILASAQLYSSTRGESAQRHLKGSTLVSENLHDCNSKSGVTAMECDLFGTEKLEGGGGAS